MTIPNFGKFALALGLIVPLVCLQFFLVVMLPISSSLFNSDSGVYDAGTRSRLTYGLTVIHCKESMARMDWINYLPKEWKVTVYETCGQSISPFSQPFENGGSEECSAYLNTMIEQYKDPYLPDINLFVQSDVLLAGGRKSKKLIHEHSPFYNITDLVSTVQTWAENGGKFLHFGPKFGRPLEKIADDWHFQKDFPRQIMDVVERNYTSESFFETRSGACFAVHKDRILANSADMYVKLKEKQLSFKGDHANTRKFCCAFEYAWHAFLGEPFMLPYNSSVDHIWHERVQELPGGWSHQLQNSTI